MRRTGRTCRPGLLGGVLPFRALGTGTPVVVLGGLAADRTRPAVLAGLADRGLLARYAGSFTGYSVRWRPTSTAAPTMADVASDVAAAIRREFGRPVPVIGVSTGGSIAQQLAVDHPDVVSRLVLVSATCRLAPAARAAQRRALEAARAGHHRRAWGALAGGVVGSPAGRAVLGIVSWVTSDGFPDSLQALIAAEDGFDVTDRLDRITAPTLLVSGTRDRACPPELVRETAHGIPGSSLVLVPGRGHLGLAVDPSVPGAVLSFLTGSSRAALPPATVPTAEIVRPSATDLSMGDLSARSPVPQNLGGVLVLDGSPDPEAVRTVVVRRLAAVPRLRQQLVRVPPGAGRPVWVDDPAFDASRHVRAVRCPPPGDQRALLDLATDVLTEPLPRDRPRWSATIVSGLADSGVGVLLSLHHVLVDGMAGVAVLGRLVDGATSNPPAPDGAVPVPRPRASYRRLVADAWGARIRGARRLPAVWRGARRMVAAGGGARILPAEPCSLLARTGPRRRVAVATADLAALRAMAHRYGGTVNDALLAAIAGALSAVLGRRGESIGTVRIAVLVTARREVTADRLGNAAAPLVVEVPTGGDPEERLRRIAGHVRAARASATGTSLIGLLGGLFRLLAAAGIYRWYLRRQRRCHTVVSNVPGPDSPCTLAGVSVAAIVPVAVGEAGNMTVSFVALSYAGTLTVSVVADPDAVPDLTVLAGALQRELDALAATAKDSPDPGPSSLSAGADRRAE